MPNTREVTRRGALQGLAAATLAGSRRCPGAGARRSGADLSQQADPHHRRLRARRRQRHLRAPDRPEAQRAARPARVGGEQAGRRRRHRHRLRGQVAARWLHAAGGGDRRHDHQPGRLQQAALRDAAGFRAAVDDRLLSAARHGQRQRTGEEHRGAGGLRQGQPGEGQLCQLLARLPARHRAVQAEDGSAARAHRLQEQRRDADSRGVRRGAGGAGGCASRLGPPESRQDQGPGGHVGCSASPSFPTCRP